MGEATMAVSHEGSLTRRAAFWMAVAFGLAARSVGLLGQTLIGDELHAFRFAPELAFPEVLYTFHWTANSPPLNAWLRLLMELGLQPSELALRIPVWLTGLALLVVVPWWLAPRFGQRVAVVVAWLLAVSPQLVFYSRFMRPYVPMVLTTAVAAGAFWSWWREGSRTAGWVYAVSSVMAMWLHPVVAPFVMMPWAVVVLERIVAREPLPSHKRWLPVMALQAVLLLCIFGPAFSSLFGLAEARRAGGAKLATLADVGVLLSGSTSRILAVVFWLAVIWGAVILSRRNPRLARFTVLLPLAQLAGVPVLTPAFINNKAIFARYVLVGFTPLAILVALAVTATVHQRLRPVFRWAPAVLVAAIVLTGPLTNRDFFTNPLATRPELLHFPSRKPVLRYEPPSPYLALAEGARGSVIEFPALPLARFFNPLSDYFRTHGRRVILSPGYEGMTDPRLGLETVIRADPETWLESGAAYLVMHQDWVAELGVTGGQRRRPGEKPSRRAEKQFRQMKRLARELRASLVESWGPPDEDAGGVSVWDLGRVRSELEVPVGAVTARLLSLAGVANPSNCGTVRLMLHSSPIESLNYGGCP